MFNSNVNELQLLPTCLSSAGFKDLRQELAVRERQADIGRMSAPSSPTQDNVKMDSAVQASLSLPATPLSKSLDNAFSNQTGGCRRSLLLSFHNELLYQKWLDFVLSDKNFNKNEAARGRLIGFWRFSLMLKGF